jgi:hypothetical protein
MIDERAAHRVCIRQGHSQDSLRTHAYLEAATFFAQPPTRRCHFAPTLFLSLGPVIGGALSFRLGWRSTFATMAILGGVMFLLMLVFLEVVGTGWGGAGGAGWDGVGRGGGGGGGVRPERNETQMWSVEQA